MRGLREAQWQRHPVPDPAGVECEAGHVAERRHPERPRVGLLDRRHLPLNRRLHVQPGDPGSAQLGEAAIQPQPEPTAAPCEDGGERRRKLHGLGHQSFPHPHQSLITYHPHLTIAGDRQLAEPCHTACRARDGAPRSGAIRHPHAAVDRPAEDTARLVGNQVERVQARKGRQQQGPGPSTFHLAEMPLLGQEPESVRSRRRQGNDPVGGQALGDGHVDNVEAQAVEARQAAERRDPEFFVWQLVDVGDGVLGQALGGRPLRDAVFASRPGCRFGGPRDLRRGLGAQAQCGRDGERSHARCREGRHRCSTMATWRESRLCVVGCPIWFENLAIQPNRVKQRGLHLRARGRTPSQNSTVASSARVRLVRTGDRLSRAPRGGSSGRPFTLTTVRPTM